MGLCEVVDDRRELSVFVSGVVTESDGLDVGADGGGGAEGWGSNASTWSSVWSSWHFSIEELFRADDMQIHSVIRRLK